MQLTTSIEPDGAVLKVEGEVDLLHAPDLRAALHALEETHPLVVVLDFSDLTFIDSSGLSELIRHRMAVDQYGGKVAIAGACNYVVQLLEIAGLDRFFLLFDNVDDAKAGIREIVTL